MNPSIGHVAEALNLLGGDIWQDGECASEAQRLLAAYADPRTHLEEHPDDAFVLEGMDLDDPEAAEALPTRVKVVVASFMQPLADYLCSKALPR